MRVAPQVLHMRRAAGSRRGARRRRTLAAIAGVLFAVMTTAQAADDGYVGRPIYSEPSAGLQLPPGCTVTPAWRVPVGGKDWEVWLAQCADGAHVWLLKRQVLEIVDARQLRLRFEIVDERRYPDETSGETLSLQCTGSGDAAGYIVRGARWRADGRDLRLKSAAGMMRADVGRQRIVDAEATGVDCVRFPERENLLKRLQQGR